MNKTKILILSCISILLPVFLSAAPIDKFYVPSLQPEQPIPWEQQAPTAKVKTNKADVYSDFRKKVKNLSPGERENLKRSFQKKMDLASKNKNFDAAKYYHELIKILDEF